MPRPRLHRSSSDRVASHDAELVRLGGRATRVRLSPEANAAVEKLLACGFGDSLNDVVNRAVTLAQRCYVPTKSG